MFSGNNFGGLLSCKSMCRNIFITVVLLVFQFRNSRVCPTGLLTTVGLAVRAGIQGTSSRNRSPDLVEDEVKFF
jgi:hypothetical protein